MSHHRLNLQKTACNTATRLQRCTKLRVAQSDPLQRNATQGYSLRCMLHGAGVEVAEIRFLHAPLKAQKFACRFLHATRRANAPGRTRDAIHDNDSRGNDTP